MPIETRPVTDEVRGEFELIAAMRAAVGAARRTGAHTGARTDDVVEGIGDDAAVLAAPPGHEIVVTTDMLVEGRHFELGPGGASGADVGWKSLAVSVSDVAAMGARARWAVVSIALRRECTGNWATELTAGLTRCAQTYGVAIVGGDTTSTAGPLVVNVTLIGTVVAGASVLRSGARVGDAICVTGHLGGSLLGRHLHPQPRQDQALSLVKEGVLHAMIDLSDGLSSDLGHVLDASDVGAVVWSERIPLHADAHARAALTGYSPLDHALHDGEDFELLFTTSPEDAERLVRTGVGGVPVAWIGTVTADPAYLIAAHAGAEAAPLERRGHDHFRQR